MPLLLFAIPDEAAEKNRFEIGIPVLGSIILTKSTDGEVKGLKAWPKQDRAPVANLPMGRCCAAKVAGISSRRHATAATDHPYLPRLVLLGVSWKSPGRYRLWQRLTT
jgi:cytochrome bd-type quinol oxidase subunit 1